MASFGDLIRVDLTTERITTEVIPVSVRKEYLGGEGINTRLLWEHFLKVDPKIDPRGPDNVLIAGVGPLAGTSFGIGSKTKFTFKSPAYNMFGDSTVGGGFGAAMRWAGHDHIVVTGRASRPVYLWIDDDKIELRDASPLWGKNTSEATSLIRKELADEEIYIATIGRAGENLVGFANIIVGERAAGRCGGGCVMGSKNLKAIAVRGTKGIPVADKPGFIAAMDDMQRRLAKMPVIVDSWRREGTLRTVEFYEVTYSNAYRNGQLMSMPDNKGKLVNAQTYLDKFIDHGIACSPGCSTACSSWHRVKGFETPLAKHFAGEAAYRPEYLSVASLGIGTDIPDLPAIIHMNKLCFEYGVDVVEMGNALSSAMEWYEKGIVTATDLEKWLGKTADLEWGNWQMANELIESVGDQNNDLGRLFKDNVVGAAATLGQDAIKYVNYGKGGATFSEDQRPYPHWSCNMAVSSRGADHLKGLAPVEKPGRKDISMAWFGSPDAGITHGVALKGAITARAENINSAINSTGVCSFMVTRDALVASLDALAPAISALTGVAFTDQELYAIGERVYETEKAFNSRLGQTRADDRLCDRWMNVPAPQGPGKGMKAADYLEQVLDEYYERKGWDKTTALQKREKLLKVGLPDVAEVLAAENALVE